MINGIDVINKKYDTIKESVEGPMYVKKTVTIQKRNGAYQQINLRKYHLTDVEKAKLLEQQTQFPNPYKRAGIYKAIVQSFIDMGMNQYYSFKTIKMKIQQIMETYDSLNYKSNLWELFINKKPRNIKTCKDINGKILQNIQILQRVTSYSCYGIKLYQLGAEILIKNDNGVIFAGLFDIKSSN